MEVMTGDELAARLYAEQGYLVIGSEHPMALGEAYGPTRPDRPQHPIVPVAISNERSWEQQNELIRRIYGDIPAARYPFYYCVEGVAD